MLLVDLPISKSNANGSRHRDDGSPDGTGHLELRSGVSRVHLHCLIAPTMNVPSRRLGVKAIPVICSTSANARAILRS
ncbi:hypothetical protein [Actinomadura litoris]|uniref:hypothetical protein n=1 Tax=Actinomadura litoris TaxID=2678616 RepID=UPI001FA70962|nr:hypothetical protein [Actinomadura litoris]